MEILSAIEAFAALASPSRLAIFRTLVRAGPEGMRSGDIAEAIGAPANTTSSHLAVLSRATLVSSRRDSRAVVYAVDFDTMGLLLAFLVEDCCEGRSELCARIGNLTEGPRGTLATPAPGRAAT